MVTCVLPLLAVTGIVALFLWTVRAMGTGGSFKALGVRIEIQHPKETTQAPPEPPRLDAPKQ